MILLQTYIKIYLYNLFNKLIMKFYNRKLIFIQRMRDSPLLQPFTSFQPVFITFKLFYFSNKILNVLN